MLTARILLAAAVLIATASSAAEAGDAGLRRERLLPVVDGPGVHYLSAGRTGLAARETAGPDTFVLYGGPDHPTEGKFELADGQTPDWGDGSGLPGGYGGGPAAWTPVDITKEEVYWHRDTFNAENLNGNGPGNHALWCGIAADDPRAAEWYAPPGYGNFWDESLVHESAPLADPSTGQVVDLEFFFNHGSEPGFDGFYVEYDSAGNWTGLCWVDGSNEDFDQEFPVPGVRFSEVQERPIVYTGNDYGGDNGDQIVLRVRFYSDGAWSHEDGLFPIRGWGVQLDDITLTTSEGSWFEDHEGSGPYLFEPERLPFAGDFADVYPRITDIDPCRENPTPAVGFIDYGQIVRNGPAPDGTASTGGRTSVGVNYGIPGSYVFNYDHGISAYGSPMDRVWNEVWSPVIQWDLPGSEDDALEIAGARLSFDVWADLPWENAVFYMWHVRSASAGSGFTSWRDEGYIYYSPTPGWRSVTFDVTELLDLPHPERIQIALAGVDLKFSDFQNNAATPSPVFDNVRLVKYRVGGPLIDAAGAHLAQGGFPPNGSIDATTPTSRGALDIPFDMVADINSGDLVLDPGDSLVARVESLVPGVGVQDVRLVWALRTNPLIEDPLRSAPARPQDENVVAGAAGTVWTGEVVAEQFDPCEGQPSGCVSYSWEWRVDLPDTDFLYPGDVLHYYWQATDDDGRVSTLPADLDGFGDFSPESTYDRGFVVRGLPSLKYPGGAQTPMLVINDFGHRGGEAAWTSALRDLGLVEGLDFDTYTVRVPSMLVSNGIGSAGGHGATAAQLAGYETIVYLSGDLATGLLSTGDAGRTTQDKGDDMGVIEQWWQTPGTRNLAFFGDNVVSGHVPTAEGAAFVASVMGVDPLGADAGPGLGGQTAPRVVPNVAGPGGGILVSDYVAYGGCPALRQFDRIRPLPGASAGHWFLGGDGSELVDPVASVVHAGPNGLAVTFPYAVSNVYEPLVRGVGLGARARLFAELFELFGAAGTWPVTPAPPQRPPLELTVAPNPFNPSTVIDFSAPAGARGTVRIFDLRGQCVRSLHTGEFVTARFSWDGTDDRGANVASGIYLVRAEADGQVRTKKVALVK